MRKLLTLVAFLMFMPTLAKAQTCNLNATPSNFSAQLAAVQPGQNLCLASGSYGQFNGAAKSGLVHIWPAPGASVSFSGGDIGTTTKNIYLHGPINWTGPVEIVSSGGSNLWIEGTWANVGHAAHEGRVSVNCSGGCGDSGVHIMNSHFGPGGCSDGVQISASGVEVGFSEFSGVRQSNCTEHVDPIQLWQGNTANIHDNWLHANDSGIMAPDGSTGTRITNNVISADSNYDMVMGNCDSCVITHNVGDADIYDGNPTNQPGCSSKNSANSTYQNNVGTLSGCGTNLVADHNLTNATFVGGTNPTTWTGYALAAGSAGKGAASDGTDIGINVGSTSTSRPAAPTGLTATVQ